MFEIGSSLREARLRKGLDFPEIETGTKIRGKYLQALEEERFDVLPGRDVHQGFLRTYAEYLGLDGQLYVDEFNSRYVAPVEVQTIRARRTAQARRQRRVQGGVLVAALVGIAVVTALVIVAWTSGSRAEAARRRHLAEHDRKPKPKHNEHGDAQSAKPRASRCRRCAATSLLLAVRKGGPTGQDPAREQGARAGRGEALHAPARSGSTPARPGTCASSSTAGASTYPGGKPQAFVVTARGIFASA